MAGIGAPVGNQFAAAGTEWRQALRRAMAHRADGDYKLTLLKIAEQVVDRALAGDDLAWQEIANREDGKPTQGIVTQGNVSISINNADASL